MNYTRLFKTLEIHAGGPIKACDVLKVDYHGCYAKWKNGTKTTPRYIVESMLAHIALYESKMMYLKELQR